MEKTNKTMQIPGGKYHHHISLINPPLINAKLIISPQLFIEGSPKPRKERDASDIMAVATVSMNFGSATGKMLGKISERMICLFLNPKHFELVTKSISLTWRVRDRTTRAVDVHHKSPKASMMIQKLDFKKAAKMIRSGMRGIIKKMSVIPIKSSSTNPLK